MFVWNPKTKYEGNPMDGNKSNEVGSLLLEAVDSGGHIEYMEQLKQFN